MENLNPGLWALSQRSLVVPVVTDGSQVALTSAFLSPFQNAALHGVTGELGETVKELLCVFFPFTSMNLKRRGKRREKT